jgi:2-C-methyl-D-erythritol 4-phosphate cytidylyltransferase
VPAAPVGRRARASAARHHQIVTAAALAIVPVDVDDRSAPLGCAALRELRGRPLLAWAVRCLTTSGVVPITLVAVPPALEEAVADVLRAEPPERVEVLPVRAHGPGLRVRAALQSPPGRRSAADDDVVVVHDPLHPLSSSALVRAVVDALVATPGCAASAPARAVTDTLKWVDEDEVVQGTADREAYRMIHSPQAYRRSALAGALAGAPDDALRGHGAEVLPRLVKAHGGTVTLVLSPGEAFRVDGPDDLVLVEALLHVDANEVRGSGSGARRAAAPPPGGRARR